MEMNTHTGLLHYRIHPPFSLFTLSVSNVLHTNTLRSSPFSTNRPADRLPKLHSTSSFLLLPLISFGQISALFAHINMNKLYCVWGGGGGLASDGVGWQHYVMGPNHGVWFFFIGIRGCYFLSPRFAQPIPDRLGRGASTGRWCLCGS